MAKISAGKTSLLTGTLSRHLMLLTRIDRNFMGSYRVKMSYGLPQAAIHIEYQRQRDKEFIRVECICRSSGKPNGL